MKVHQYIRFGSNDFKKKVIVNLCQHVLHSDQSICLSCSFLFILVLDVPFQFCISLFHLATLHQNLQQQAQFEEVCLKCHLI